MYHFYFTNVYLFIAVVVVASVVVVVRAVVVEGTEKNGFVYLFQKLLEYILNLDRFKTLLSVKLRKPISEEECLHS